MTAETAGAAEAGPEGAGEAGPAGAGEVEVSADALLSAARFEHRVGPCRVFSQRFEVWTTDAALAELLRELYTALLEDPAALLEDPAALLEGPAAPAPADAVLAEGQGTGPETAPGAGQGAGPGAGPATGPGQGRAGVGDVPPRFPGQSAPDVTVYRLLPPSEPQRGVVARDDEVLVSSPRPATLLGRLVWAINRQVIDGTTDRLLLHAGAVEIDGVGVLLPADMEAGKTTLVTGLLDRGAGYLTDEAASVTGRDQDLIVEGYAKPLSIDPGSWEVLAHHEPGLEPDLADYFASQWQVSAARVGRVVRQAPLGVVVFRRFEAGTPTRLERLGPAAAVQRAVTCTFVTDTDHLPVVRLRELAGMVERVPVYELVGGDLDAACDEVLGLVAELNASDDPTA